MGLVSLLVLSCAVTLLLLLCPWQNDTWAAQSSSTETVHAPNADVGKLLLMINEQKAKSSLKGVKNINLKIDKHGKAREIVIVAKPSAGATSIEQRIKRAAFATQTGHLRERKIRLVFKG